MAWFSPGNSSTSCAGRTPVLCSRASAISAPWCLCSSRPAWAHFESAEGCHSRAAAARGALPLMIGFERQEWEALSADERGGGRGLVVVGSGWGGGRCSYRGEPCRMPTHAAQSILCHALCSTLVQRLFFTSPLQVATHATLQTLRWVCLSPSPCTVFYDTLTTLKPQF